MEAADSRARPRAFQLARAHQVHRRQPAGARGQMQGDDATVRDFRRGLGVVESRADSLHRFVQSYRLLAQLPPPHLKPVQLGPLLERVVLLEQRVPRAARSRSAGRARRRSRSAGADVHQPAAPTPSMHRWPTAPSRCASAGGWSIPTSVVTIEDRGLGIANTENLFVPFYTTKPTGSGVGLALAQQIARAHGGEIRLSIVRTATGREPRFICRWRQ